MSAINCAYKLIGVAQVYLIVNHVDFLHYIKQENWLFMRLNKIRVF